MSLQFKSIGEFAKVKGGKRLPKGEDVIDEPSGFPYIRVTDMGVNGIEQSQVKFISQAVQEKIKRYTISVDDVYISIAGTIGRVGIVPYSLNNANLTENAAKITNIDSSYNPKFLMYFLRSYLGQSQILAKTGGTSQPKLALNRIEEIKCPYLKRRDQDSIAKIISNYDNLIENNKRRIALLEESARLLYREWFVRFRFPGHEHIKIIDGLPEGWTKVKYEDILGKVKKKGKIKKEQYQQDGLFPCIDQSKDFIAGYIDDVELVFSEPLPVLIFGDHTRIVKFIDFPFVQGADGTQILIPKNDEITPVFFYFLTQSIDLANAFYARHFKFLKATEIILPTQNLIKQFEKSVGVNMKQIKTLREMNRKLTQASDILLPRLMNGDLAV